MQIATKVYPPAVVLSAYTGFLMCSFQDMHEYIEIVLRRPVWTHEMGDSMFFERLRIEIKERGDFERAVKFLQTWKENS